MRLSIAMATYNGERYLQDQLDSFLAQTRRPDELIIADDGSGDNTLNIAEAFASIAPFEVHIYRNERNLGYSGNFEAAITRCTGDLIFLSDQDDVWLPEKIEIILYMFETYPDMHVTTNDAEITDSNLRRTGLTVAGQIQALGLDSNSFVSGCCTTFRRAFVPLLCPFPDVVFAYDSWLNTLSQILEVRRFVPQVLQYYRRHDDNTSNWVANSTKRLGKVDLVKAYGPQDPRHACRLRLERLVLLESRLMGKGSALLGALGLKERIKTALEKNAVERVVVMQRLQLLEKGRLRRLLPAVVMFIRGHYRHFSGWKSFVKDLIIP